MWWDVIVTIQGRGLGQELKTGERGDGDAWIKGCFELKARRRGMIQVKDWETPSMVPS